MQVKKILLFSKNNRIFPVKQQDLSGKTTGDFKKTTRSFEINNRFFGKRMS